MTMFDFSKSPVAGEWVSLGDPVMGGVSTGRLAATGHGAAVFAGTVSLANNGGFSSVRSPVRPRDMRTFAGIALRVRGDGRRYKINLKTDNGFDGVLYSATFETARDEWLTVTLRFEEFIPTFRGRAVSGAEPLDPSRIVSLGLMISERQAGPFRLEIARIDAFRRSSTTFLTGDDPHSPFGR